MRVILLGVERVKEVDELIKKSLLKESKRRIIEVR